jgi:AcrR family transcriptional regulator
MCLYRIPSPYVPARKSHRTARTVLREGAVAFPAQWPAHPRSALLAGMAGAAARSGFARVRVEDVVELARGSRRTFYTQFRDIEDCLLCAHAIVLDDCLAVLDALAQDPWLALAALMEYLAAWPTHARLLLIEILAAGPAGVARNEEALALLAGRLAHCLTPAASSVATAEQQAQARIGAVHRLILRQVVAGGHAALPQLTPVLAEAAGIVANPA